MVVLSQNWFLRTNCAFNMCSFSPLCISCSDYTTCAWVASRFLWPVGSCSRNMKINVEVVLTQWQPHVQNTIVSYNNRCCSRKSCQIFTQLMCFSLAKIIVLLKIQGNVNVYNNTGKR